MRKKMLVIIVAFLLISGIGYAVIKSQIHSKDTTTVKIRIIHP